MHIIITKYYITKYHITRSGSTLMVLKSLHDHPKVPLQARVQRNYLLLNNPLIIKRSLWSLVDGIVFIGDLYQLRVIQTAVYEGNNRGQHD